MKIERSFNKKGFWQVIPIVKVKEEKGCITSKKAEIICDKSSATVRRYFRLLTATGIVVADGNTDGR